MTAASHVEAAGAESVSADSSENVRRNTDFCAKATRGSVTRLLHDSAVLFDVLVVLGWVFFCAALPAAIRKLPRVRAKALAGTSRDARDARISVIVPARNEEQLLPRCLDSVRAQQRPIHELIVVDDTSQDATARVATNRGAHVISAGTRPAGWTGKPWAAHVGANAATGDWLLFVDADAVLAPGCVEAALAEAEEHGVDLLSLIPAWRCSTLLESLVQPVFFILLSAAFDFHKMNDPAILWRPRGVAFCSSAGALTRSSGATPRSRVSSSRIWRSRRRSSGAG